MHIQTFVIVVSDRNERQVTKGKEKGCGKGKYKDLSSGRMWGVKICGDDYKEGKVGCNKRQ